MRLTEAQLRGIVREEILTWREHVLAEEDLREVSDVDRLVRYLDQNGIPYEKGKGGHYQVRPKGLGRGDPGAIVTFASTPGGGNRGLANARAMLKRALELSAQKQGRDPYPELPKF